MKARVCIIGGGFAGLAAAGLLARKDGVETVLYDPRTSSEFLPVLPDVAGLRLPGRAARASLPRLAGRLGFRFVSAAVRDLDTARRSFRAGDRDEAFDAVIVAAGSRTNLFGRTDVSKFAYCLDSVADAERITAAFLRPGIRGCAVVGGGYTGVELATHLSVLAGRTGLPREVTLVEAADSLVARLPSWMREYVDANVRGMGIAVRTKTTVDAVDPACARLSDGTVLRDCITVWSAGVVGAAPVGAESGMDRQLRLAADGCLRVSDGVYAAGDAVRVDWNGQPLRMSVQFALQQGRCAASNVLRQLRGVESLPFKPVDPGYVIPMANGRSCGEPLGIRVRGRLPGWLHYLMSVYSAHGFRARSRMLRGILAGPIAAA